MIDNSAQPYGLVIPPNHDFSKPCPVYVWLHGRGDKNTDLHFLFERATKPGQITPRDAIVVHPFGRHCVGWKHAGERDVFESTGKAAFDYGGYGKGAMDLDRCVLIGFSMGGAGAWHAGAHASFNYVAIAPGAGFAETAQYNKLTPDKYPPWYEQKLWGMYDTPAYVRNLFNTEVIAYSGELDKQIQAARVMEAAYQTEGRTLTHLIGPGVEHKYEPNTLSELLKRISAVLAKGKNDPRKATEMHFQTRTLQYSLSNWFYVARLKEHWQDSRIDAKVVGERHLAVVTKNINEFTLGGPWDKISGATIDIDGQSLKPAMPDKDDLGSVNLEWKDSRWQQVRRKLSSPAIKSDKQHGPIDHAFMIPFVVITPSGKSRNAKFQEWCDFELAHFRQRWQALMRAKMPEMKDTEASMAKLDDLAYRSYVLWGDADSNILIRHLQDRLPAQSASGSWRFGNQEYDGNKYVPVLCFPRHTNNGYIVLNSGLTFREGHDRTNSQQNPKLPDWAIIDITQPPGCACAGTHPRRGVF